VKTITINIPDDVYKEIRRSCRLLCMLGKARDNAVQTLGGVIVDNIDKNETEVTILDNPKAWRI